MNARECLGFALSLAVKSGDIFLTNEKLVHTSFPALDACFCSILLIGSCFNPCPLLSPIGECRF